MKLNIFIVSVACFACLAPPAYGSLLVAKAMAAAGALKGAALLGVGALAAKGAAKHAALKSVGAAVLAAKALAVKGAMAKGAALLAAKKAAVGGALAAGAKVLGKGAALMGRLSRPTIVRYEPVEVDVRRVPYRVAEVPCPYPAMFPLEPVEVDVVRVPFNRVPEVPCPYPAILADRLSALTRTATSSLEKTGSAASDLLAALSRASAYSAPVVSDQSEVMEPGFYSVPVVEKDL